MIRQYRLRHGLRIGQASAGRIAWPLSAPVRPRSRSRSAPPRLYRARNPDSGEACRKLQVERNLGPAGTGGCMPRYSDPNEPLLLSSSQEQSTLRAPASHSTAQRPAPSPAQSRTPCRCPPRRYKCYRPSCRDRCPDDRSAPCKAPPDSSRSRPPRAPPHSSSRSAAPGHHIRTKHTPASSTGVEMPRALPAVINGLIQVAEASQRRAASAPHRAESMPLPQRGRRIAVEITFSPRLAKVLHHIPSRNSPNRFDSNTRN